MKNIKPTLQKDDDSGLFCVAVWRMERVCKYQEMLGY